MKHEIAQAQGASSIERPAETIETLSPCGRVTETTRSLDRLRSRIVLARKPQHRPRHLETAAASDLRQPIALFPGCVMRVAACDLHGIDSEPIQKQSQLRHILDLKG